MEADLAQAKQSLYSRMAGRPSLEVFAPTPASLMPLCGVQKAVLPSNTSSVPWLFDVFASHNRTRAYFIAQTPTTCYSEYKPLLHEW
jgi:hypothetical protein